MADDPKMQQWLVNHQTAVRAHEQHYREHATLFDSIIQFALEAIRSGTLINGGAVIAVLALIGAIWTSDAVSAKALFLPAFIFAIGAIVCGVAAASSYCAQYFYMRSFDAATLTYEWPYKEPDKNQKKLERIGAGFHVLAVVLILTAYGGIACGVWTAWEILSRA